MPSSFANINVYARQAYELRATKPPGWKCKINASRGGFSFFFLLKIDLDACLACPVFISTGSDLGDKTLTFV